MDYSAKKTLVVFSELCGDANFANVGIVTTHWSVASKGEDEDRERVLRKTYFKHLIDGGAKMFRHDGGAESAKSIVSEFVHKPPVTLKIQEELNAHRALADTSAGGVIMKEMKEMEKEHKERMQDLKEEMAQESEVMRAELEAKRRQLEKQIAQIQEDQNRLQMAHPNTTARPTRRRSLYRRMRRTTRRRSSFGLGLFDYVFSCKGMTVFGIGILSIIGLYFAMNNKTSGYGLISSLLDSAGLPFVVSTANSVIVRPEPPAIGPVVSSGGTEPERDPVDVPTDCRVHSTTRTTANVPFDGISGDGTQL